MKPLFLPALVIGVLLISQPAVASSTAPAPDWFASPQGTEISAKRKKARRDAHRVDSRSPYFRKPGIAPSFGYIGPPGYAGEYAWRRSIGQCVEDLGYGRWSACGHR